MAKKTKTTEESRSSVSEKLVRTEFVPPVNHYLSTGSTLMDLAISNTYPGGLGGGRITQIYGDESTAKSVLVQQVLGAAQRQGGFAIFQDAEHTLDFGRACLFGLNGGAWANPENQAKAEVRRTESKKKVGFELGTVLDIDPQFVLRYPYCTEYLFDDEIGQALELIRAGKIKTPAVIGVDSMTSIPSIGELGSRLEEGTYDTNKARTASRGFRKYLVPMAELGLSLVIIDQTRDKIGASPWESKKTTGGGHAIEFYASTRIQLGNVRPVRNTYKQTIGVDIKFKITKNKIAPPFREGDLRILFDTGIDDLAANVMWLQAHVTPEMESPFGTAGPWFAWGEQKVCGVDAFVVMLENANLEEEVAQEVARVWHIIHQPTGRKLRYVAQPEENNDDVGPDAQ
jgi:recombination protein RecA